MANSRVREESIAAAAKIGVTISPSLPLLGAPGAVRDAEQALSRLLAMHAVAAAAYGFDRKKGENWIAQERLGEWLTGPESSFVRTGNGPIESFRTQVEGMWALAWSIGLVEKMDFSKDCDSRFVGMLPNLKTGQSGDALRGKAKLRPEWEILGACDLAYCLHWAVVQSGLEGKPLPPAIKAYVIKERRHAFEWLISSETWDQIPLDT